MSCESSFLVVFIGFLAQHGINVMNGKQNNYNRFGLEGGVALITGGAQHLGLEIAQNLCLEGMKVAIADIQKESVLLLVETAEKVSDIDKDRAESARQRAHDRMKDKEMDNTRNRVAMARARNRLKISGR